MKSEQKYYKEKDGITLHSKAKHPHMYLSRHFNQFFLSINFSHVRGSFYGWSIAGFLHGASPKAPVVPRTPSLLINRLWTGALPWFPSQEISRNGDCWRAKPADRNRERHFPPLMFIKPILKHLLFFFPQENACLYVEKHINKSFDFFKKKQTIILHEILGVSQLFVNIDLKFKII